MKNIIISHRFKFLTCMTCMFFTVPSMIAGSYLNLNGTAIRHLESSAYILPVPVIVCPENIFKNTDPYVSHAVVQYTIQSPGTPDPLLTYTFSGATTKSGKGSGSGSRFSTGITMVTITAANTLGTATCTFSITISDKEGPDINCPLPISGVDCLPDPQDEIARMRVTDNGGGKVTISYVKDEAGTEPGGCTITRTFSATDDAGNFTICNQIITVNDNTPPALACPENITVTATSVSGAEVNYISPVGSDNCTKVTTVQTAGKPGGSVFPIGNTTNTFVSKDMCGNTATCSFIITVIKK